MKHIAASLLALSLVCVARPMLGDAIPYPNPGTIAPTVLTFASSSGGINVYFDGAPSNPTFTDFIQVKDLNTGFLSPEILNNQTTALGTMAAVGTAPGQINAGDQLVFYIVSPDGLFASVPSLSADGVNHAYITAFSGGTIGTTMVPAGLYVGMEDLPNGISDFNYTDDTFVFTGVTASAIPEPNSLLLLGTGALSALSLVRRKVLAFNR